MKKRNLLSIISLALVLMFILSVVGCIYVSPVNPNTTSGNSDITNPEDSDIPIDYTDTFFLIDQLFKNYSIFDVDYETAMLAAIKAYTEATGDRYAIYYTEEEFAALQQENQGDLYGIGVQVIFDYDEHIMEVILVMPDSPAEEYLQIGDVVTHIYDGENMVYIPDIVAEYVEKYKELHDDLTDEEINNLASYEAFQYCVSKLKGAIGTYAEFRVLRNGESIDMKIVRAKVKTVSVTCKKSIRDESVGIVAISQFDLTTPTQFKECMDKLIAEGCDKFVFDLRNNPGGDLASVTAVLSTLLQYNDVIVTTKDSSGAVEITRNLPVNYTGTAYSSCTVTQKDIGKYSEYEFAVIADGNTASAGELFTAALRDYELAEIVGTKTYGKGSAQSIITLKAYGNDYVGGLRFTTMLYFPPCGIGYDGKGIDPDHPVELEGIAAETHFYKLTEDIDNQLQKAVSILID